VEPAINLRRMLIGSTFCVGAGTIHDKRQINICQFLPELAPRPGGAGPGRGGADSVGEPEMPVFPRVWARSPMSGNLAAW